MGHAAAIEDLEGGRSMAREANNRSGSAAAADGSAMAARAAYQHSMGIIWERLTSLDSSFTKGTLLRTEYAALQVRKIIEGVAFAALSAVEHINSQVLAAQRSKDADKLLVWLNAKGLLRLPAAQRIEPPPSPDFAVVLSGSGDKDWSLNQLKAAYSRSSSFVHERHPELITSNRIAAEAAAIEEDADRLSSWLWVHIMFLRGEGFLVQMAKYGTPSFFLTLTRQGDIPPGL
jgi:hypothetical protein